MALIIERRNNQSFWIGDHIKVTLLLEGKKIRVFIDAPRDVAITRDVPPSQSKKSSHKERWND